MYINVKLLNGYQKLLTYKVPASWDTTKLLGAFVHVPLQNRVEIAIIDNILSEPPSTSFIIKEALSLDRFSTDNYYHAFIQQLSAYYCLEPLVLYKRMRHFLDQKEVPETLSPTIQTIAPATIILTSEQQSIINFLTPPIQTPVYTPTLVHGVTGSGKTEVYKKLITTAHQAGKSIILLLPEVSLAVQFAHILRAQLSAEIPIFSFHSAASVKEKKALWQHISQAKPALILGVHLPILLPIANLGLIIVDEEHEVGYQEKKHPKINTKEAALLRAQITGIPIVLGSATPSISSLYNIKSRNWNFFEIKQRFSGEFPLVKIVKINGKTKRYNFWISKELDEAITDRLLKKEQTIIFLNRRGYSFFIQCSACSFIFVCNSCSVSLTLHDNKTLRCHYCNFSQPQPTTCTSCKAPDHALLKKGIGTQQIVTILEKMFPQAKIGRADLDATINKKKWQTTLDAFAAQELDILVGTQTITKGYHFPKVTLVGLIWADINLSIPVFNAAETALQQLIQVAGRAGRQSKESLVIVQTMINHPIFDYSNEIDYPKFYTYEIAHRTELNYPPCARLVELEIRNSNEQVLDTESQQVVDILHELAAHNNLNITILGPAQPPVHKIKNVFMRKIYIKSANMRDSIFVYKRLIKNQFTSTIFFTPNPLQ